MSEWMIDPLNLETRMKAEAARLAVRRKYAPLCATCGMDDEEVNEQCLCRWCAELESVCPSYVVILPPENARARLIGRRALAMVVGIVAVVLTIASFLLATMSAPWPLWFAPAIAGPVMLAGACIDLSFRQ